MPSGAKNLSLSYIGIFGAKYQDLRHNEKYSCASGFGLGRRRNESIVNRSWLAPLQSMDSLTFLTVSLETLPAYSIMNVSRNLKEVYPQKYYMKLICNTIYYLGFGDCWYEPREKSNFEKRIYPLWAFISNFYTIATFFDEFLANCRTDLTDKEKNDVVQFTLAHSTILGKIVLYYVYKKDITFVLYRLIEGKRFICEGVDKACVKRFLTLSLLVGGVSYITLATATVDGIKAYYTEGIPVQTEILFYPKASDSGLIVNILRFLAVFHWFYAVAMMACIDCLCICSLVIVGFKFKAVQVCFESLSEIGVEDEINNEDSGSRREIEEQRKEAFVEGIKLHEDALWCAKNVQTTLGNLYSVQVFESVVLLVMCLIKLVRMERSLTFLLANSMYIVCLIVITGAYMMAGGDITYEAGRVSTSIFQSGWERGGGERKLCVLAMQRSQVPVWMLAFHMMTLSYGNFITVIRSSYSFFAVMY